MKATYYELTEENKEHIFYHTKTFEEIDEIGFDILDNILNSKEKIENYKIPIRSILYRLLEINDALSVMVKNSLITTSVPLLRSEFEMMIQIIYILKDSDMIEEKALLYHYCDIRRINYHLNKEELNEFLDEHVYLKDIHKKYKDVNSIDKTSWYSAYEEKRTSFKKLCEITGYNNFYNKIYPHLSADAHGTGCTELNTAYINNKYYLQNFRTFKRDHTLMIYHIDFFRKIFFKIIDVFEENKDIRVKVKSFCERSDEYINIYHQVKEHPIFTYEPEHSF